MTNLTDEGLRQEAQWICDCKKQFKECLVCQKIASALQLVRDAAKKETREKAAKLMEEMGPVPGSIACHERATAIRQMDGGK